MTPKEAWQLLVLDSAFTGRAVDKPTATVWAEVLADVSLTDASEAVKAYYATETKWLMPGHITGFVRERRQKALPQTMSPEGKDCTKLGRPSHQWMDSGYCLYCEQAAF